MPACCFVDVLKTTQSTAMEGDRDRRILATLIVQLEETEEQIDSLQQLRSDLLEKIANTQQHILLES